MLFWLFWVQTLLVLFSFKPACSLAPPPAGQIGELHLYVGERVGAVPLMMTETCEVSFRKMMLQGFPSASNQKQLQLQ